MQRPITSHKHIFLKGRMRISSKLKAGLLIAGMVAAVALTLVITRIQSQTENEYKHKLQQLQDVHTDKIIELKKSKEQSDKEIQNLKNELQSKRDKAAADAIAKAKAIVTPIATAQASQVPQNASGDVQGIIVKWANHYGLSAQHMLNIARCESTFNPNARNSSYSAGGAGNPVGLFQHVEGYWPARAAKYGVPGASIYDADAQARVTAAMFADGQAGLWECR